MSSPTPPDTSRPAQSASEESQPQQVVQNANAADIARFVTTIKNVEQQVGEHVIQALQHADTVAVLTTVVVGPGGQQHIVSAALDPARMAQVNALLQTAVEERQEEELCVGFHCLIKPKIE